MHERARSGRLERSDTSVVWSSMGRLSPLGFDLRPGGGFIHLLLLVVAAVVVSQVTSGPRLG